MVQSTAFLKNSHFANFYLRITFFYLFEKNAKKDAKKGKISRLCLFSRIFKQKIGGFEHFTKPKKCAIMTKRSKRGRDARRSALTRSINLMIPTRVRGFHQPCIFGEARHGCRPKAHNMYKKMVQTKREAAGAVPL